MQKDDFLIDLEINKYKLENDPLWKLVDKIILTNGLEIERLSADKYKITQTRTALHTYRNSIKEVIEWMRNYRDIERMIRDSEVEIANKKNELSAMLKD